MRRIRKLSIFLAFIGNSIAMIKPQKNISDIKRMIHALNSQRVRVKVNLGRNKIMRFSGVLSGVYPALFTIEPDEKGFLGKTAYSYSDVLCGNVKLTKYEEKQA